MDLFAILRKVRAALLPDGLGDEIVGPLKPVPRTGPWQTPLDRVGVRNVLRSIKTRLSWSWYRRSASAKVPDHPPDMRLIDAWFGRLFRSPRESEDQFFNKMAPRYGKGLAQDLRRRLDVRGKGVQCQLLQALCRLDAPGGLAACRDVMRDGSPEMRMEALQRLVHLSREEAERKALQMLEPSWPVAVRSVAIHVLHQCRGASGKLVDELEARLTDRSAWDVCQAALPVLTALGEPGKALVVKIGLPLVRKGRKKARVAHREAESTRTGGGGDCTVRHRTAGAGDQ
jgi:hypothetical protein